MLENEGKKKIRCYFSLYINFYTQLNYNFIKVLSK